MRGGSLPPFKKRLHKKFELGGSPGLVVMGGDSWSEGCGFESWHRKLDGYFFTHICCLNCNFSSKRPKINDKRGRGWPIFKKFDFTQVKHFHESLRLLWDIADSALKQNIKDALKRRFLKKERKTKKCHLKKMASWSCCACHPLSLNPWWAFFCC